MTVPADAQPDVSRVRMQVLLAARGGCRPELAARVAEAAQSSGTALGPSVHTAALVEIDDDPFPAANPGCRPFDAVVELEAPAGVDTVALVEAVAGPIVAFGELIHGDLSGVLVGAPQRIIPSEPTALRYLYLMRRRAGTSRAAYFDYYFHQHSRFGFVTPGIAGYTQFHVDADASSAAARRLGLGTHAVDSVSELHFHALDGFFAGVADGRLGAEAGADEERFVDRANSVSFCTRTVVPAV
jgi:hypothetical protein